MHEDGASRKSDIVGLVPACDLHTRVQTRTINNKSSRDSIFHGSYTASTIESLQTLQPDIGRTSRWIAATRHAGRENLATSEPRELWRLGQYPCNTVTQKMNDVGTVGSDALLVTMEGSDSLYSAFEIHSCWNVLAIRNIDPLIHTEYLCSGGATTLLCFDIFNNVFRRRPRGTRTHHQRLNVCLLGATSTAHIHVWRETLLLSRKTHTARNFPEYENAFQLPCVTHETCTKSPITTLAVDVFIRSCHLTPRSWRVSLCLSTSPRGAAQISSLGAPFGPRGCLVQEERGACSTDFWLIPVDIDGAMLPAREFLRLLVSIDKEFKSCGTVSMPSPSGFGSESRFCLSPVASSRSSRSAPDSCTKSITTSMLHNWSWYYGSQYKIPC